MNWNDFFRDRWLRQNRATNAIDTYHLFLSVGYSYLSPDPECRRDITDDLATSCLRFCLSSTALCDSGKSSPVHSLALSSHSFLCLSRLLALLTVLCKMICARPDDRETSPHRFSFRLFTVSQEIMASNIWHSEPAWPGGKALG